MYLIEQGTNLTDGKSWTGCGKHVASVMDPTPKEAWCTCEVPDNANPGYPPKAGTGFAKKTI